MMYLRLVDRRTGEVLDTHNGAIRTTNGADSAVRNKHRNWKRGGLTTSHAKPQLHIQAELLDGATVLTRWVWMETAGIRNFYGPSGEVLEAVVENREMRWVQCDLPTSDYLAGVEPKEEKKAANS